MLVQCKLVDNEHQQSLKYYTLFCPINLMLILLNVEPGNLVFLKTFNTEFDEVTIVFTDQNGRPLKIEVNFTFLFNK